MTSNSGSTQTTPSGAHDEELCLMGVTRLADFLDFVRKRAVGGPDMDKGELVAIWRDASKVFDGLQTTEAGVADKPDVRPLTPFLQAHVDELVTLPHFQASFQSVPVAFGMVELDKLVVYQQHITQSSVQKMTRTLQTPITEDVLAGLCLPLTADTTGFHVTLEDDGRFIFSSGSHDARFLGAQVINPADIKGFAVSGHPQTVIALSVGFTTNILNVVRYGPRMVLNNGYHRAMALRQLGVTHAPCLIQVCSHWEEVGLAGSNEIYENSTVYFSAARPPLLRDYTNGLLTKSFTTWRTNKEIRVSYEVDTAHLAQKT
ncbi:MAG: hypothetical protein V4625_10385 [Pseudomonadota bacterium]